MKKPTASRIKPLQFSAEQTARNVHTVRMKDIRAGWEQWFLLSSDRHHDNPHTDQSLERKHLEQAKERRAGIIDAGDLFCAMQGKFDKRSSKDSIRPEHVRGDYLDALVKTAADFYKPYAAHFISIGQGNHETGILKNHETNLTERLVERINTLAGSAVQSGGYSGWVRFLFESHGGRRESKNLHYFHGSGGGGPVTRGVITTNRMAVYLPDADFVVTGHTHDEYNVPIARARLSAQGKTYIDEQRHIRCPSYKDEYADGFGGWHVETGKPPKPKGAMWLRFYYDTGEIRSEVTAAR